MRIVTPGADEEDTLEGLKALRHSSPILLAEGVNGPAIRLRLTCYE